MASRLYFEGFAILSQYGPSHRGPGRPCSRTTAFAARGSRDEMDRGGLDQGQHLLSRTQPEFLPGRAGDQGRQLEAAVQRDSHQRTLRRHGTNPAPQPVPDAAGAALPPLEDDLLGPDAGVDLAAALALALARGQ